MKGVEEKTFDLTIGRVRQTLIQYALPLVVMNLMQSLYSMADLLISGHFIGSRGISGINNSSQVMLLVTQIAIGLSQGGNILIGQFFGAREEEARKETTNTLFYSFMILSLATAILLRTFASSMLMALGAPCLLYTSWIRKDIIARAARTAAKPPAVRTAVTGSRPSPRP